jgi:aldose 1-epimerase
LEEQRIGRMYVNLFKQWLTRIWESVSPRGLRRSSALPGLIIAALILIPSFLWYLHIYGRFSKVKREIKGEQTGALVAGPRPGGSDPIILTRAETPGSNMPEFLSATILPGLGMGILQITASMPNRGEVPLLVSPSLATLADSGSGPRQGVNDNDGALELPWGGAVTGLISPLGTSLTTAWRGHTISVPRDPTERPGVAEGGLIATQGADSTQVTPQPTGATVIGEFKGTDFDGHWPGRTNVTVTAQLGPRILEITVVAKNVGDQPEPMGIGWHPRFIMPSGNREAVELRLPNGGRLEIVDRAKGIPSGRTIPLGDALGKFMGHPAELGSDPIDETLISLKPALLDTGSAVELRDPANGFGLRMTAVSPSIKALRITAPAGARYISLGMQTNYDDALGKEWNAEEGGGIATLAPGQSLEWKVRLEIFSIMKR